MKKAGCFLFVLLLIIPAVTNAQSDVSVSRKEFLKDKEGFKEAWDHVKNGDSFYAQGGKSYANAFDEYLAAFVYNSSNAELNYKTGVAALFSDRKEEAAAFLLKAIELKKNVTSDVLFLAGRALQYEERYDEAIEMYNDFIGSAGKKTGDMTGLAKKYLIECNSALAITKDTLNIRIENLGMNINSASDDYSEVMSPDGKSIYFASKRTEEKSSKNKESDENIYIAAFDGSSWLPSARASKNINSDFCETPLYINPEGDNLYIYAGYQNEGDIRMSVRKKDKWNSPQEIPFPVNSADAETSFTMSPDGQEIYFVSQGGKGNLGGRDIFYITKLKGRKWSKPKNAGDIINTAFDEESVAFSKKGDTLWFSSKGHNSIGGYDVFYSVRNSAGAWDSVKNAGYPVNTPWDELFYKPSPVLDSVFYFSSNRKGGFGGLDIYTGKIMPFKQMIPADTFKNMVSVPDTLINKDKQLINEPADSAASIVESQPPLPAPAGNKDEPVSSGPAQSDPDGGAVKPEEINFLKI